MREAQHGFALPVYASWSRSPVYFLTTTQHSVPAGSLLLAGQVHLLLGHYTRFQLYMSSSSSVFIWRTPIEMILLFRGLNGYPRLRRVEVS